MKLLQKYYIVNYDKYTIVTKDPRKALWLRENYDSTIARMTGWEFIRFCYKICNKDLYKFFVCIQDVSII